MKQRRQSREVLDQGETCCNGRKKRRRWSEDDDTKRKGKIKTKRMKMRDKNKS